MGNRTIDVELEELPRIAEGLAHIGYDCGAMVMPVGAAGTGILAHLAMSAHGRSAAASTEMEVWQGLSAAVVDAIADDWYATEQKYSAGRQEHYFSAEFLMGRALLNNLTNLGLVDQAREAVGAFGQDLTDILEQEPDAALGNGGLGRLAACFLDSCATLELPEGQALRTDGLPEPGPRLQDILDTSEPPAVSVRETFDFWLDSETAENPEVLRSLEDAKEEIAPTAPVPGVEHAYWCRMNGKEFVRWVRGEDEDEFFNAFARIYAARESDLEEGARFVGAFRANGVAIPVWELVPGTEAEELTKPLQALGERPDPPPPAPPSITVTALFSKSPRVVVTAAVMSPSRCSLKYPIGTRFSFSPRSIRHLEHMEKLPRVLFTEERFVKRMRPKTLKSIIAKEIHIVLTGIAPFEREYNIPSRTVSTAIMGSISNMELHI